MRRGLKLGSQPLRGTYLATQLAGDSPDAYNDVEPPDRVVPQRVQLTLQDGNLALPPHCMTILEILDLTARPRWETSGTSRQFV